MGGRYSEKRMAILEVNDADFSEKVLQSKTPVLVDFYADWCGPCKMAEPVLEELAEEYKGRMLIAKVNVDNNPQTVQQYTIMSIPTTILVKSGQEIGRQVGFAGKEAFEKLVKKAFS